MTYDAAVAMPDPLTTMSASGLNLERCCQSPCATEGTPQATFNKLKEKCFFFFFFVFSRAAPGLYGGSQARGLIGTVAAGPSQSHSNATSEPHLPPTPQLTAMLDP